MKQKTTRKHLAIGLTATVFALWQAPVLAIPKAAEHEDAQVTVAPDVAKPKAAPKTVKKEVRKKPSPPAKKEPYRPASKKSKGSSAKD